MYAPFKLEREYIDRFSNLGIDYEPLMDGEYSHDDIIEYLDWEEREKERQLPEYTEPIIEEAPQVEAPQVEVPQAITPQVSTQEPLPIEAPVVEQIAAPTAEPYDITIDDAYTRFKLGMSQILGGPAWLVKMAGEAIGSEDMARLGTEMTNLSDQTSRELMNQLSEGAKRDMANTLFEFTDPESFIPTGLKEGATPSAFLGHVVQGAGSTVPMLAAGGGVTQVAKWLLPKLGVNLSPGALAWLGLGSTEAALTGSNVARGTHETIHSTPRPIVYESEFFKAISEEIRKTNPNATDEDLAEFAVNELANETALQTGVLSGAVVGVTIAPFARLLGRLGIGGSGATREGLIGAVFKGTTYNFAQEWTQGGSEKLLDNYSDWVAGRPKRPWFEVGQQAALEGAAGGPLGGTVAGITRLATPDTVTPQPDIVTPPDTTEVVAEAKEPDIVPKIEVTEETKIPPFATEPEYEAYQAKQKEEAYQVKRAESDKLKAEKEAAMSDEEKAEVKETARLTTVYTELSALTKDVREGVIGNSYEEWNTEKKYRGIIAKLRGSRIKGFKKESTLEDVFAANNITGESIDEWNETGVVPEQQIVEEKKPEEPVKVEDEQAEVVEGQVEDQVADETVDQAAPVTEGVVEEPKVHTKEELMEMFPWEFDEKKVGDRARLAKEFDRYVKARVNNKPAILKKIENLYATFKPVKPTVEKVEPPVVEKKPTVAKKVEPTKAEIKAKEKTEKAIKDAQEKEAQKLKDDAEKAKAQAKKEREQAAKEAKDAKEKERKANAEVKRKEKEAKAAKVLADKEARKKLKDEKTKEKQKKAEEKAKVKAKALEVAKKEAEKAEKEAKEAQDKKDATAKKHKAIQTTPVGKKAKQEAKKLLEDTQPVKSVVLQRATVVSVEPNLDDKSKYVVVLKVPQGERTIKPKGGFRTKSKAEEFARMIRTNENGLAESTDQDRRTTALDLYDTERVTKEEKAKLKSKQEKRKIDAQAKAGIKLAINKLLTDPKNKRERDFILNVIRSGKKDQDYIMQAYNVVNEKTKELELLLAGKASKGKIRSEKTNVTIRALTREIQENKTAIDNWKNQVLVMGGKWAADVEETTEESEFILKEYGTPENLAEAYANNMKGLRELLKTSKLKVPAEYVWDTKGYFRYLSGKKLNKTEEEDFRLTLAKKIISKEKRILKKILDQNIAGIHGYNDALGMARKAYDVLQKSHDRYMEALNANADKKILKALAKDVTDAEEALLNTANVLISHKLSHNNEVASLDLSKHRAAYLWINEHYGGDPFFITEGKLSLAKLKEQAKEFKIRTTKGDTRKSIAQKIADKAFNATVDGHTFGVEFIVTDNLQEAKEKYATKVKSIVDTFKNAKVVATKTEGIVAFKGKDDKAFMRKYMNISAEENLVRSIDDLIADINYGSFLPSGVKPEDVLTSLDYTKVLKDETDLGKLLNEHKKSSSRLTMATRAAPQIIYPSPTASKTIIDEDEATTEALTEAVEGQVQQPTILPSKKLTEQQTEQLALDKERVVTLKESMAEEETTIVVKKQAKWDATSEVDKKLDDIRAKYKLTDKQRNKLLSKKDGKQQFDKIKKDMQKEFEPLLKKRSDILSRESKKYNKLEKDSTKKLKKLKGELTQIQKGIDSLERSEKTLGKRGEKKKRATIRRKKDEFFNKQKKEFDQAEKLAKDLDKFETILVEIGLRQEEQVAIKGGAMRKKGTPVASRTEELQAALEEGSASRKRIAEARKKASLEVKSMRTKKGIRIQKPTDAVAKKTLKRLNKMKKDGSVPLEFDGKMRKLHYHHSVSKGGVDTILVYKNVGGKIRELPLATVTVDKKKIHIDYFRSNITSSQSSEAMQKIENKEAVSIADVQAGVDIAISDVRSKRGKKKAIGTQLVDEERLELVLKSRPTREGYDQPWFSDQEAKQYEENVDGLDLIIEASVSNLQLKDKEARDVKKRFKPTDKIFKEQQKKSAETNAIIADLENKIKSAEGTLKKTRAKKKIKELENTIFKLDGKLRTVRNEAFKHAGFSPMMPRVELKEEHRDFDTIIKMAGDPFYSDQEMLKVQEDFDALQNANKRVLKLREDNKLECP